MLPFWIELDVQFCGGAHHDPVVITLSPWGCHFLVYVANVFCLEAVILFFFEFTLEKYNCSKISQFFGQKTTNFFSQ
jgi:hypothetical protein